MGMAFPLVCRSTTCLGRLSRWDASAAEAERQRRFLGFRGMVFVDGAGCWESACSSTCLCTSLTGMSIATATLETGSVARFVCSRLHAVRTISIAS